MSEVGTGQRTDRWIGLVYHDVQPAAAHGGGGPARFAVPLASFECMLDTLVREGYAGCSVARACAAPGTPRVAITFDDGASGQYDHAFPALLARGMTATFYITTDWVGRAGYVTWDQLREMAAAGMSVQSHTHSHPFLSELDPDRLRAELAESKRILDQELGQDTTEIAFPGGDAPISRLRPALAEAGYRLAVGSRWGSNGDGCWERGPSYFIRRCTVRGVTDDDWCRRVVHGDARLTASWVAKESALRRLRATLGATRYTRWRRRLLDALARQPARA